MKHLASMSFIFGATFFYAITGQAADDTTAASPEIQQTDEVAEDEGIIIPLLPDGKTDVAQALKTAQHNFDELEYDIILPYVEAALRETTLTPDQKLLAYLLKAQALAITGDPVDAERPFRLLLRVQPDFNLPPDTPPKITGVFSRVQSEENAIRDQVYRLARARKIQKIKINGSAPSDGKGGTSIWFTFTLEDPDESVTAMKVGYRRLGEGEYSTLALKKQDNGEYKGFIPADWTESETDFKVEIYTETQDRDGPLRRMFTQEEPGTIEMVKGMIPYTVAPKVVYGVAAGAGAFALGAIISNTIMISTQAAKDDLVEGAIAQGSTIDGKILVPIIDRGNASNLAGWVCWGGAVILGGVASALYPFMETDGGVLDLDE
jgi:hypothetical protein